MKSLFIKIAIFLIGGGAGFLAGKKVYESYYAQIAQEEIDSIKDLFERRRDQLEREIETLLGKKNENKNSEDTDKPSKKVRANPMSHSSIENTAPKGAKKAYNLVNSAITQDDEGTTDETEMTESEAMDLTQVDRTSPYVIDGDEFTNGFDHHDKLSLYYYRGDDILCDEHEIIIENADEIIGDDALGTLTISPTIWVRNEPMATDFEVTALNGTYAQMVGAKNMPRVVTTPREEYLKRQEAKTITNKGEEL